MDDGLFPGWQMAAFKPPGWVRAHGLHNSPSFVSQVRLSWPHWGKAKEDGLDHLSPILVAFNASPQDVRDQVGGHAWHAIRTASRRTNVNRAALMHLGAWSLDEALCWPVGERRMANKLLTRCSKSELLIACKHTERGEKIMDHIVMARDFERMGGQIDRTWGRKRLKREHDALAMRRAVEASDPTPWAERWCVEIDGYRCTLLISEEELAIEGALQRHCVKTYAATARQGKELVFSIDGPERATAGYNRSGNYLQVRARLNGKVSKGTRLVAEAALTKYLAHLRDRERQREGMP